MLLLLYNAIVYKFINAKTFIVFIANYWFAINSSCGDFLIIYDLKNS